MRTLCGFYMCFCSFWLSHPGICQDAVLVLGVAQDGGYPHLGCQKACCQMAWSDPSMAKNVVSLALVDTVENKWWLFEATPDLVRQLHLFQSLTHGRFPYLPEAVFITHAHIGHYTGLMQFGREAMNTRNLRIYALPRMNEFLRNNGPWSQLVQLNNVSIRTLEANQPVSLGERWSVSCFVVPHRDEYSETAGFFMHSKSKSYLFIPDIDKWEKWDKDLIQWLDRCDIAFLDGTFLSAGELGHRNIQEIPHPLVQETVELTQKFPQHKKIRFIHFNHTNPLMWSEDARLQLKKEGFECAAQGNWY